MSHPGQSLHLMFESPTLTFSLPQVDDSPDHVISHLDLPPVPHKSEHLLATSLGYPTHSMSALKTVILQHQTSKCSFPVFPQWPSVLPVQLPKPET